MSKRRKKKVHPETPKKEEKVKEKTHEKEAGKIPGKGWKGINKTTICYVLIAAVFFVIGFFIGPAITGCLATSAAASNQLIFISPQGCINCSQLESVAKEVANTLGIPFVKTGFPRQVQTPGFVLLYNDNFLAMSGFESEGDFKQGICQLTENDEICEEAEELAPAEEPQPPAPEVVKSDRPAAELYIFSYCPAGTAALDSFARAADFLKDYADFKVGFFSHMHGEHEHQENMIQECIQKIAPEKYWDYTKRYVEEVYKQCASTRTTDCDKEKSAALMTSVGINASGIMKCVEEEGETLYQQDIQDASNFGLSYSPSLVVNNFPFGPSYDRSPEGVKAIVCSAFNTPPEKCSQALGTSGSQASGAC